MNTTSVALELYTVRDETARDFAGTLRRVAEMGYPAVEFAGYGGLTSKEMAALLAETGLRAVATHVGLAVLEQDLEAAISYCLEIGCSLLVIPWLAPELRNAASIRSLAPRFNEMGRRCREHGVTFGYHNHDFEFQQSDGEYLLDILLKETDPALVTLELDVYWAAYAGVDPIAYLRRYAGRVPLVHLKDMSADRTYTEVGDGLLDIAGICKAGQESGVQWYAVEHDQPRMPSLESARRSLENLRRM
ncbi:MAG: sugar phosphate isomerase/epimerase [Ktedonobacteraceae bacterium]